MLFAQAPPTKKELKAKAYITKGKPYKAIALSDDHLTGKTAEPAFYVIRAEAYNMIGEHIKAEQDARRSMAAFPGSTEALFQLAIAEQGSARNDSALIHLQQVLSKAPSAEVHFRLALTHQQRRDHAAALADLERAAQLGGATDRARVERMRGECHAMLGDSARSRQAFDSALAISPRDPVIWNSRGFFRYATFGEHARALVDYDQAIKFNPNYSFAFNNRGWSLYKLGDTEKAMQNIILAERKKPFNPYLYRNKGIIKIEQGDIAGGCAALRQALEQGFTEQFGPEVMDLAARHCPAVNAPAAPAAPPANAPGTAPSNAPGQQPAKRTNAP